MATADGLLRQVILLVLGVQLEDDLCQLGDLLRHFVVGLLGDAGCFRHYKFEIKLFIFLKTNFEIKKLLYIVDLSLKWLN